MEGACRSDYHAIRALGGGLRNGPFVSGVVEDQKRIPCGGGFAFGSPAEEMFSWLVLMLATILPPEVFHGSSFVGEVVVGWEPLVVDPGTISPPFHI